MPPLKPLIKEIGRAAKAQLAEIGFRKRKATFTKDINPDTIGVVGLNRATYPYNQLVQIYPIVGIINRPVGKLDAEWSGFDQVKMAVAMIAEPLCYLLPEKTYTVWPFQAEPPPV